MYIMEVKQLHSLKQEKLIIRLEGFLYMFFSIEPNIEDGLIEHADGTKLSMKGICKSGIYASDKDDFAIFHFEDEDGNCFKIKGNIKEMLPGNSYAIEGVVKSYNGEKQLSVYTFLECKPCSKTAVIAYLQTLPGLMSKAELIFDKFGMDSIDILEKDPIQLTTIKGIGQKSVEKWTEEIQKTIGRKYTIIELLGYGFTQKQCVTLLKLNNPKLITDIRENPYRTIQWLKNFGFLSCDKIAMNMKIEADDARRISSAIGYILELATQSGHCYLPIKEVIPKAIELLKVKLTREEMEKISQEKIEQVVKFKKVYDIDMNNINFCLNYDDEYVLEEITSIQIEHAIKHWCRELKYEEDRVYLSSIYNAEKSFAKNVVDLCKNSKQVFERSEVESVLDLICRKDNITLEAKQREAVIVFNMYDTGFFILNGSAGTGKTFVAKLIMKVNQMLNHIYKRQRKITLLPMAPTGKASRVMSKSLGQECITIHRGLQYTEFGFTKNENDPFDENTVYVDEVSMLDINLAASLLKAIDLDTKLIFIGDTKQLPSVGPGKVLKDLIESGIPKMVTLDIVKRQGKFSGIIRNANRIIFGEDIISEPETNDFFIKYSDQYAKIQTDICNKAYEFTKTHSFQDVQVLTPQRPGLLGVNMLNYLLQKGMNPIMYEENYVKKGTFEEGGKTYEIRFHYGDKVINVKNDYNMLWYDKKFEQYIPTMSMGVTNGECGIVDNIRRNEQGKFEVVVKFDGFYAIYEDVSNLELAYALTIHKSQGSQWPVIIMPIVTAHNYILSNNLLYTAVTRASEQCYIYGQQSAIHHAVTTFKEEVRNTTLQERLQEAWNGVI